MEKARIGIIGLGNQGSMYLKKLFNKGKIPNGEVTAVCDINPDKIKALEGELHGAKAFADYKDLLASGLTDGVIVAVPHYQHPEISIAAMEAGINVLCEKPAGVYTKQVKEMNAAAAKSDKLFAIMFNQRTNCVYRKMREMIACGAIGNIKRVNWIITNWYRSQSYYDSSSWRATWKGEGGGVLVNQAPHQLDLLLWYMGDVDEVYGVWKNLNHPYIEVEDTAVAVVKFKSGAVGNIVVSNSQNPALYGKVHVFGENGAGVGVQTDGGAMFIAGMSTITEPPYNDLWTVEGEADDLEDWKKGDCDFFNSVDSMYYYHQEQIKDFLHAVETHTKPLVDARDGRKTVELFEAIYRSTQTNSVVKFPIR